MNQWRPDQRIKVKAIGLHWRNGRLLAAEVFDDRMQLKGVRPLGGSAEFGERWQQTLVREFREELGVDIEIASEPHVMENIYTHEGRTGHEILFVAEVAFSEQAFAGQDRITFHESDGTACEARWYELAELDLEGGPALFPRGLKDFLLAACV